MKKTVIGMGEVLWDMLPSGRKLGGAPANFAYHVKQFGFDGGVVSAVGRDALGKEIQTWLHAHELARAVEYVDFPTGTVDVSLDSAGVPTYNIRQNVAWDHIGLTPQLTALAAQASAVCFGSLAQRNEESRATILAFLHAMPDEADCWKIFDINLRQSFFSESIIVDSLKACNVLKINDEELEVLCPMLRIEAKDVGTQCRTLLEDFNLRLLILTCGATGSYVFTPDEQSFLPTPLVTVADTVGAGDSFTAAFTAGLLRGYDLVKAHRRAVEVSAYVCTQAGAMPTLPASLLE